MQTIGRTAQELTTSSDVKTQLSMLPQEQSMATMPLQTHEHLRHLLDQCFDVFDIFGKKPEQVANVLMAFNQVLAPFTQQQITVAFRKWMDGQSKFPTPAEIKKLIQPYREETSSVEHAVYQFRNVNPRQSKPRGSWVMKDWSQFTQADKEGLIQHLKEMTDYDKADGYARYLSHTCFVPRSFMIDHLPAKKTA